MRVHFRNDPSAAVFSDILLQVGDGKIKPDETDDQPRTTKKKEPYYEEERTILGPRNDVVRTPNDTLLKQLLTTEVVYKSCQT